RRAGPCGNRPRMGRAGTRQAGRGQRGGRSPRSRDGCPVSRVRRRRRPAARLDAREVTSHGPRPMTDRRRNLFVLLLVAGLLVASLVVIATKQTRLGLDLKGGVSLIYQAKPTKQSAVTGDAIDRSLDIMRKRVDQIGVAEPSLQLSGADQIDVSLPDVKNADEAAAQVGTTAQMWFYDWEGSVLGKDCKPHPDDPNVTAGTAAGSGVGAVSLFDAVTRAAKCPATNTGKESSG